ncbi:hypothetical protein GJW-30_1_02015 [Variibacter gotjawalensis]|uniref:Uncharacterized protein n=1 Tax=Variibacter gotjawalensis TaxID=1333996 RepID=A0A0S3PU62_9BRAD|nr:DUF4387 family protein [Variibacter gotjawalensis]NIK49805.1 hypothetical protein [Variibacter gotjawalensis]RZS45809.1 uncharacterized protein DUF1446 [Variibacter gotjawalensis]BAT59482.1 hypothetical protein GJW-30_1_02015 [Variibacter gotjawalensis]
MPQLIYRAVSACGALGYGFPKESFDEALNGRVDAIVADGGSMDAGPSYLGAGTQYFERDAVRADYYRMVEASERLACPVIIGNSGMAGGARNLAWMVDVAKDVFAELGVQAKTAVIASDIDSGIVLDEFHRDALLPIGRGLVLEENAIADSIIVGQMGVHPLISALDSGAQYVIAGRACDVALFAADMIRRGIAPGLAYHVGYVLACGALACEPGSPSDCLVAEVYDDGSAIFIAPNADRRCTPLSIAAHSLYEESHPLLQFYPEGILALEKTDYFSSGPRQAGIRNSHLVHAGKPWPWSIKLDGARRVGDGPSKRCAWTLHHLLQNEDIIKRRLFPITVYDAAGDNWTVVDIRQPRYFDVGDKNYDGSVDERTLTQISDVAPNRPCVGKQRLSDLVADVRSRDAGVNRVTLDIMFSSGESYEAALYSNLFSAESIAALLDLDPEQVVGAYFVDSCNAIKITIERPVISQDFSDAFAAYLVAAIKNLNVPIYASALARASSF